MVGDEGELGRRDDDEREGNPEEGTVEVGVCDSYNDEGGEHGKMVGIEGYDRGGVGSGWVGGRSVLSLLHEIWMSNSAGSSEIVRSRTVRSCLGRG